MKYITTAEAGKLLGVKSTTVSIYCQSGKISGRLIGRTWQVSETSVRKYAAARKRKGRK
jgi:excisionase family DNA binding protein